MYSHTTVILGLVGAALCQSAYASEPANANSGDDNGDAIDEIIVSGEELGASTARIAVQHEIVMDSAEALRRLPGADRNQNGRLSGIAQFRGMFGDRVPVTIDGLGVISGGPNAMDPPLAYASPMITAAIVIERGIAGVASAPESIGGHVDVELARGEFAADDNMGIAGMAGARYANNGDTRTTAARVTAANRSHRLSLVGQLDRADDLETPVGNIVPSRLSRDRYDVSYAFRGQNSEFGVFAGKLDTRDTGTPALAMDIRHIDSDLYGVNATHEFSPRLSMQASLGYNDVDHVMDNFSLRPAPGSPMQYRQNRAVGSGGVGSVSLSWRQDDYVFTAGIDGRVAEHDSVITNPNSAMFTINNFKDVERDLVSGFAVLEKDSGASSWEAGLRYTSVTSDAGEVSAAGLMGMMAPAAGQLADAFNSSERSRAFDTVDAVVKFSRQVTAGLRLGVDLGTKTRAPSYQELYLWLPLQATGGLADGRNYIGNLDLESERSAEIAVGADWQGERLNISPQAYFKRVDNYIQGVPTTVMPANMLAMMMSGAPALQFDNVEAEIYGFDLGWQYRLADNLHLLGNAAYVRGRRTDVSDNLYRLPPANGSLGLRYTRNKLAVRTEVIGYAGQDKVSAYNGELPTAGYGIVNALATWAVGDAVRIDVEATNLFDRGYQDHLAGVNRVHNADIPAGERLWGAGRTLTIGAVIAF